MAAGGQILVSRQVHAALADEESAVLRSVGSHRLRGIPDELELFEVLEHRMR
jgi:class 3 adenylate cyclase